MTRHLIKPSRAAKPAQGRLEAGGAGKGRLEAGATVRSAPEGEPPLSMDLAREMAEGMLVEGYTFEDVLEAVNTRAAIPLTLGQIEHFYRDSPHVQKGRIRRLLENYQELRKALGSPETVEGQLAEATFFNGYLNLHRPGGGIGPREAFKRRMEINNLELRVRNLALKDQRAREVHELHRVKIRHDLAQLKLLRKKIRQLEALLHGAEHDRKLGGETLRRIHEIYGIATRPINPPAHILNRPEGEFADPNGDQARQASVPAEKASSAPVPVEGDLAAEPFEGERNA